jgi:Uma2 family endonuclease
MSSQMPARFRFSVADFHRLGDAGIIKPRDHIELIDGELMTMAPMGSWHAATVALLHETLLLGLAGRAIVSSQTPLVLDVYSEPEPDLMVLRPRADRYRDALPGPGDVLLLIEVGDTTAHYDRGVKAALYARHGIPALWVVDRQNRVVWVHGRPLDTASRYDEIRRVDHGRLALTDFPAVGLEIADLF